MSRAAIENGLYAWVNAIVGIAPYTASVLFANQDFSRATKPFVSITLGQQISIGFDDNKSAPSAVGISTITGERKMMVTLEAYGAKGNESATFDLLNAVLASLEKFSVRDSLYNSGGIAVHRMENILNLTEVVDTNYEPRFALDLIIGYKQTDTEDVSWVKTVEIEGEMETPDETKIVGPFEVELT